MFKCICLLLPVLLLFYVYLFICCHHSLYIYSLLLISVPLFVVAVIVVLCCSSSKLQLFEELSGLLSAEGNHQTSRDLLNRVSRPSIGPLFGSMEHT